MNDCRDNPTVSVCVSTYNHQLYIRRCLLGILEQVNDCNLEIIIGDDASTDNTREIVISFSRLYSNIRTIFHPNNIGPTENYKSIHRAARGKYVVHIDGDDYMYPTRILEQVGFLIKNQDCSAVVHQVDIIDANGNKLNKKFPNNFKKIKFDYIDILCSHPLFAHSSLTYRRSSLAEFLSKDLKIFIDFEVYLELSKNGLIGVVNQSLGAYRISVGISAKNNLYQLAIDAIERSTTGFKSENIIKKALARQYFLFAKKAFVDNDFELMERLISKSVNYSIISPVQFVLYLGRNYPVFLKRIYRSYKQVFFSGQ